MPIKLNGATSGSVELGVPAAIGSDISFTLPSADGNAGQFLKTDGSNQLTFTNELPNNYAFLRYKEAGSALSRNIGTTETTDPDISVTTTGYKRGDIIIVYAYVPVGIALASTDQQNYVGLHIRPRLFSGSTVLQGQDTKVWFRSDGRATKEAMQLGCCFAFLQPDSTTFNDGDDITFTCTYQQYSLVASGSTGLCNWHGRRHFQLFHYRKEI